MPITPKSAFGAQLLVGDGADPEVFTSFEGVTSINGPTRSVEEIDVTHHASAGDYRESIPSFKDPGTISFDLIVDTTDTLHAQLASDFEARVNRSYRKISADAGDHQEDFVAYVQSLESSEALDDAVKWSVTLRIAGAITVS